MFCPKHRKVQILLFPYLWLKDFPFQKENKHSILYIEVEIKKEFQEKYTINKFLKLEQKEIFGNSKYNNKKIEIKFILIKYPPNCLHPIQLNSLAHDLHQVLVKMHPCLKYPQLSFYVYDLPQIHLVPLGRISSTYIYVFPFFFFLGGHSCIESEKTST